MARDVVSQETEAPPLPVMVLGDELSNGPLDVDSVTGVVRDRRAAQTEIDELFHSDAGALIATDISRGQADRRVSDSRNRAARGVSGTGGAVALDRVRTSLHALPHQSRCTENRIAEAPWMAHLPAYLFDDAQVRWS